MTTPIAFHMGPSQGGMPGMSSMPGMPGMPSMPGMSGVPGAPGQGPSAPEPTTRDRIDRAKTIARRAARHWAVSTLLLLIGGVISIIVAMYTKNTYRSETVISFRAGFKVGKQDEGPAERAARLKPKLDDQLKSRARLEKIIKENSLYPENIKSRGMVFTVDEMRDKYVGFRGKDSERYVISFEHQVPETAQKISQRLAETLVEEFGKENLSQIKQQVAFLTEQETKLSTELETANRELTTFLAAHPEFAAELKKSGGVAPGPGMAVPGGATPGIPFPGAGVTSDPQINALLRQKARINQQLQSMQSGGNGPGPIPPELEARRTRAIAERDAAQNAFNEANSELGRVKAAGATPANPDYRAAEARVTAAKNQLDPKEAKVREIEQEIRLAQQQSNVPATKENIDKLKAELAMVDAQIAKLSKGSTAPLASGGTAEPVGVVALETTFQRLFRKTQETRTSLNEFREQVNKARLELASEQAKSSDTVDIAEPAYLPTTPAKGGKTKVAITGGVLTLIISLLYALGRVVFSDRIIDSGDVQALQLIPVLGVLPKIVGAGASRPSQSVDGAPAPPGPGSGGNSGPGPAGPVPPGGAGPVQPKMQGGRSVV